MRAFMDPDRRWCTHCTTRRAALQRKSARGVIAQVGCLPSKVIEVIFVLTDIGTQHQNLINLLNQKHVCCGSLSFERVHSPRYRRRPLLLSVFLWPSISTPNRSIRHSVPILRHTEGDFHIQSSINGFHRRGEKGAIGECFGILASKSSFTWSTERLIVLKVIQSVGTTNVQEVAEVECRWSCSACMHCP
jgi:hypothetical protein